MLAKPSATCSVLSLINATKTNEMACNSSGSMSPEVVDTVSSQLYSSQRLLRSKLLADAHAINLSGRQPAFQSPPEVSTSVSPEPPMCRYQAFAVICHHSVEHNESLQAPAKYPIWVSRTAQYVRDEMEPNRAHILPNLQHMYAPGDSRCENSLSNELRTLLVE